MSQKSNPQVAFLVDDYGLIIVDAEKALLVQEVIKHYTPRWVEELHHSQGSTSLEKASSILHKLSVEHTTFSHIAKVNQIKIDKSVQATKDSSPANSDGGTDPGENEVEEE